MYFYLFYQRVQYRCCQFLHACTLCKSATTLNIYAHVTSDMQRQAAVKIDQGIGKAEATESAPTEGATGASSFLGEGNIHCEKTVCLYSFSAVTTGGGKIRDFLTDIFGEELRPWEESAKAARAQSD